MPLVFQYGSNTSVTRLNSAKRLAGDAQIVGAAHTTNKYEIDFTVWSKTNECAAADIVPEGSIQIWGILYEIPENLIFRDQSGSRKSLDAIEDEGGNYKRTKIQVISNGKTGDIVSAITYVVRKREENLKTSLAYASEIINGLKNHNIPKSYLEYVYHRILQNNKSLQGKLPPIK